MSLHRSLLTGFIFAMLTAFMQGVRAQDKPADYRLGEGDSIRISVFQNPDLTLETRVSENGMITFPLIGAIKIGGLPLAAAGDAIASALKGGGFIQQPQVNVLLLRNIGNQVSVLGYAARPGRYPLDNFVIRLSEVMALAGGINPTGGDTVIVMGTRAGKPFRQEIDTAKLFLENKTENNLVMAGGDVVYVPKQPMFYIYGEVQRPGAFRVERNMSVRQALTISGGVTQRGTVRSLGVFRRNPDGKVDSSPIGLDDAVLPDDVFLVREGIF